MTLVLSGCSVLGGESGELEDALKGTLPGVYGAVDSVECAKSDSAKMHTGESAYDCKVAFAGGLTETWCAGFTSDTPAWDKQPCRKSNFAVSA
jgi:hypothetical protein